jgi:type 1 glutamine amidotransferase
MKILLTLLLFLAATFLHAAETRVLIVVGPSKHPPGSHEVAAGGRLMKHCLESMANVPGVKADVVESWPDKALRDAASTVVFIGDFFPPNRLPNAAQNLADLDAMMQRGCGIVCVHYATGVHGDDVTPEGDHPLLRWLGGYFANRTCKHHESFAKIFLEATIEPAVPQHPVSRGWKAFTLHDEPYYNNYFGRGNVMAANVTALATSMLPPESPKRETVAWCIERPDGGRGFGIVMPHFYKNWRNDDLRRFILNGIVWSAKVDVPAEGVRTAAPALADFGPASIEYVPPPAKKAAAKPAEDRLEQTKALCREYTAGFISPETDLAYGHRINGPKGIGALEKPEEIMAGRVRGVEKPMGYGSGIEDLAYHNALLLYALCDAEEKTGETLFAEMAHRAFRGLKRMSELSPHRGFVPRGPHPDGKSYYKDSSLDQHTLYLCGLWRFYHSRLIKAEEKTALRDIVRAVIMRLKDAGWAIHVEDGKAKSWEGGSMLIQDGKMPLVLLCMVAIAADVLDDAALKADYERFATEDNARRFTSLAKPQDMARPRRYTMFQNQHIIRAETLRRIETDPKRRSILRQRTVETAEDMLQCAYLHAFRALEWLGEEPTKDASLIPAANRYLAPLRLTFDSPITSLDLLPKFDPQRENPATPGNHGQRYEAVALANPAMVCHIAIFSERPEVIAAVQPSIDHLLTKVDWKKVNMGWAINYGTLAALWSLATEK